MSGDPLHIVDVEAVIGFEQHFAGDDRALAAVSPAAMRRIRIFTPSLKRNRRSSTTMPPSGREAASVTSKPPIRFSVMPPGAGPPISQPCRLPAPLASPSPKATSVPFNRPALMTVIASMPRLALERFRPARQSDGARRRSEPFGVEGIAHDPVLSLERKISGALSRGPFDHRHAFGVPLCFVAERLSVGPQDRAEHGILQAFQLPSVIVERRPEPAAGIGDGKKRPARGIDGESREAAEMSGLGVEIEPGRGR